MLAPPAKRRRVHRKKAGVNEPEFDAQWMPIYEQARLYMRLYLTATNAFPRYVQSLQEARECVSEAIEEYVETTGVPLLQVGER